MTKFRLLAPDGSIKVVYSVSQAKALVAQGYVKLSSGQVAKGGAK